MKTDNTGAVAFYEGLNFLKNPERPVSHNHYLIHGQWYHAYHMLFDLARLRCVRYEHVENSVNSNALVSGPFPFPSFCAQLELGSCRLL